VIKLATDTRIAQSLENLWHASIVKRKDMEHGIAQNLLNQWNASTAKKKVTISEIALNHVATAIKKAIIAKTALKKEYWNVSIAKVKAICQMTAQNQNGREIMTMMVLKTMDIRDKKLKKQIHGEYSTNIWN